MNQLMEEGYSIRAASRKMEEESGGKYKASNIRELFRLWMAKVLATKPRVIDGGVEYYTPDKYIKATKEVLGSCS